MILDVTLSDLWIIDYIKIIPASPNYIPWTLPSTAESLGWHAQFASTDSVLLSWSEDKFKYSRSVLSWFVLYSDWFLTVSGAEPLQTRRPSLLLNNRVHQKRLLRSASLSSLSESPDFCTSRIVNDLAKASVCEFFGWTCRLILSLNHFMSTFYLHQEKLIVSLRAAFACREDFLKRTNSKNKQCRSHLFGAALGYFWSKLCLSV